MLKSAASVSALDLADDNPDIEHSWKVVQMCGQKSAVTLKCTRGGGKSSWPWKGFFMK